jgi:hypothetical protein
VAVAELEELFGYQAPNEVVVVLSVVWVDVVDVVVVVGVVVVGVDVVVVDSVDVVVVDLVVVDGVVLTYKEHGQVVKGFPIWTWQIAWALDP